MDCEHKILFRLCTNQWWLKRDWPGLGDYSTLSLSPPPGHTFGLTESTLKNNEKVIFAHLDVMCEGSNQFSVEKIYIHCD